MYRHATKSHRLILIVSLLILLIAVSTYTFLKSWYHIRLMENSSGPYFTEGVVKTIAETDSMESGITGPRNNAIVQAIRKIGASVVSISTMHVVRDPWFEFFDPFGNSERKYYGLGSGFIIDERGYIVTNHHVIADADVIKVTLSNGKHFEAKIVGSDQESDLAVLKIDSGIDLTIAELGNSSDLMVGEWAIAIGNPFGYMMKDSQPTVTVGVISAAGRTFQKDKVKLNNLIQTDAAINPGNSGGPLVNSYGQVIGINTAIFSTTGGYQGVGFAIPINTAKKVITKLIEHGMIEEPWLGADFQELTDEIVEHLNLKDNRGALVSYVADGSPAQKAGLMTGDVLIRIGNNDVKSPDDAIEISRLLDNGEKVAFRVFRKGEFRDVLINIEESGAVNAAEKMFGFAVQSTTPEMAKKYGFSSDENGVIIIRIIKNSPAYRAELKVGDLILRMVQEESDSFRTFNVSKDINNLNDFIKFVSGVSKGQIIRMVIEREGELWQARLTASES